MNLEKLRRQATKESTVSARLHPELKAWLLEHCLDERVSVSALIEQLISDYKSQQENAPEIVTAYYTEQQMHLILKCSEHIED